MGVYPLLRTHRLPPHTTLCRPQSRNKQPWVSGCGRRSPNRNPAWRSQRKAFHFFLLVFQDWKTSHWYSRFSRTTLKHQSMSKIMHRGFGVWESPAAKNLHFKQKWNFSWSQTLAFRLLCGNLNILKKISKDFHVDRKIKMYQEVFVIAGERIIISESLNWL